MMYYNPNNNGNAGSNLIGNPGQIMYKNASAGAYTGPLTGTNNSNGMEGVLALSKDHLNESSNYLSDHP
jgi:hypothetical protein